MCENLTVSSRGSPPKFLRLQAAENNTKLLFVYFDPIGSAIKLDQIKNMWLCLCYGKILLHSAIKKTGLRVLRSRYHQRCNKEAPKINKLGLVGKEGTVWEIYKLSVDKILWRLCQYHNNQNWLYYSQIKRTWLWPKCYLLHLYLIIITQLKQI